MIANSHNFQLKYEENKLLKAAFEASTKSEKITLLERFYGNRKERESLIGDIIQCEYMTETVEGMAVYVQCQALRQLSEEKYQEECNKYISVISKLNETQFDIRMISYYVGAILLLTAYEVGLHIEHSLSNAEIPVSDIICCQLNPTKADNIFENKIGMIMEDVIASRKKAILEADNREMIEVEGKYYISGYDPMNMIRYSDKILCSNFIRLTNSLTGSAKNLFGTTILYMVPGSKNEVFRYKTKRP